MIWMDESVCQVSTRVTEFGALGHCHRLWVCQGAGVSNQVSGPFAPVKNGWVKRQKGGVGPTVGKIRHPSNSKGFGKPLFVMW